MGSDLSWELASLPMSLGGAVIASPLPICDAAVVSSWIGGVFGSVGGPTVSILEGFQSAVQNLAGFSPALGRPRSRRFGRPGLWGYETTNCGRAGLTSQRGPRRFSDTKLPRSTPRRTNACKACGLPRRARVQASG